MRCLYFILVAVCCAALGGGFLHLDYNVLFSQVAFMAPAIPVALSLRHAPRTENSPPIYKKRPLIIMLVLGVILAAFILRIDSAALYYTAMFGAGWPLLFWAVN